MKKKIYITGGTGFLGKRLTSALKEKGYEVNIFTRRPNEAKGEADNYIGYPETLVGLAAEVEGAHGIINLAGAGVVDRRWTDERKKLLYESRIDITSRLSEAIGKCENPSNVFLSSSGSGYYGARASEKLTEKSSAGSDFLAKLCVDWEEAAFRAKDDRTKVFCMRTGIVLDKEEGALPKIAMPFRFHVGGHLGNGHQFYPWVHIDDVVGLYVYYLECDATSGSVNLTAPNPLPMKELCKEIARARGTKSWLHAPDFAIKLVLGEAAMVVLEGQNAIPEKAIRDGYEFKFATAAEALQDIYS
ncbi:MAG: TIGR01777 family oxidoreductase [Candidatus Kapaibacteriales bacterium]